MHFQKNLIVLSALIGLPTVFCLRPNTPAVFADSRSEMLTKGPAPLSPVPVNLAQTSLVKDLLENASEDSARTFLTRLTQFPDRYWKSQNGIDAAKWIQDQVIALNSSVDPNVKLTVRLFEHSWKMQPSVIARLESAIPTPNTDIVITGTHLDTIAYGSFRREPNPNPAADDCASGSTVVFESLRVLVEGKMVPTRPIGKSPFALLIILTRIILMTMQNFIGMPPRKKASMAPGKCPKLTPAKRLMS